MSNKPQYLDYRFQDTALAVSFFDELPLWSAPFGLLLLKNIKYRHGMTVLDAGSGTGFPLLELASRLGPSSTLYGIDTWVHANDRLRKKIEHYAIENVTVINGSADNVPLEDNSIDLVVSNLGINNFDDAVSFLKESHRLLKHGGNIAMTTNVNGHWGEFYDVFSKTLSSLGRTESLQRLSKHQEHRGSLDSISKILGEVGFKEVRWVQEQFEMSFADGSTFLNHHFVKLGWMESWRNLLPDDSVEHVFSNLEDDLNQLAQEKGELRLTVPMLFIESTKE